MPVTDPAALFIAGVSKATGIDPRVVTAWVVQENAYAPNGTGHFNFLNLRPYPGDPYSSVSPGNFEQFSSVTAAIAATVRRLKQPFAAPILAATRQDPGQQIAAIAGTGWDSGHYGGNGGVNLKATFAKIFSPAALTDTPMSPDTALAVAATAGTGDAYSGFGVGNYPVGHTTPAQAAGDAAKAASGALTGWVGDLTGWVEGKAGYAAVYLLLVGFALLLIVVGLLRALGVRFGSMAQVARGTGELAAA